ncbi:MAG: 4Fe-4S ferredoxin [Nocardioides sp.]|nr:4Fe-4S ferredoxin [Nocardioides sp.]
MTYVVTQSCCADASCVVACPVNCIHPAPGEPGFGTTEMLYVDAKACVGCGACATACPVDAIKPDTSLTPDEQPFLQINADYFDCFPHRDRTPLAVVPKQRRLARSGPFRVAVVGAGPAGLYTADELLKHPEVSVDVYDRLPAPYGLVRYGVAPDHPHTKRVEQLFRAIEEQPGFAYRLGVEVGRDVDPAVLAEHYDAVVTAVGASADRRLDVPGEDLRGSLPATAVVGWYNGHPDRVGLDLLLDHERAVVVGTGNVALDVARLLTASSERLAATDVDPDAADRLAASAVREVVVLGRRGPADAAFTLPELVGLAALSDRGDLDVLVEGTEPDDLTGDDHRSEILRELAARPRTPGRRAVVLRFRAQPVAVLGDADGRVRGLEVERTRLETGVDGRTRAVPTGETEVLDTGLVLRSVGYRGLPVAGLPFDEATGTVPHERGRVADRPGQYVVGWIKRGPSGFIGSNKADAEETVATLLDDLDAGATPRPRRTGSPVEGLDLAAWRALDAEERRLGGLAGRPRTKLTDLDAMRRAATAVPVGARRRLT